MATVVSAISWYSLLQMLFLDKCIYIFLFSWLADAFQPVCHVQLHLHLAFSGTWGYFLRKFFICIPRFLWPADTSHWNCASSTCSFYALRILPSKIMHPRNFASSISENPLSQISSLNILCVLFTSWTEPIHDLQKNWYKKFERIWNERWWHLERKFLR